MIRARNAINPNHACHSADVLTVPERHANHFAASKGLVRNRAAEPNISRLRHGATAKWSDCKHIRDALESIKGTT